MISPNPHRGPLESKRRSLQIFDVFTATRRKMLLNSRNELVYELASMKSAGDRSGRFVRAPSSATAASANPACAQIFVPMAVPPKFIS